MGTEVNYIFQDALGPSGENTPYLSSDESDCGVVTNSEDLQLSKEEIEERKTKVLEIKEKGNILFRCHLYSNALKFCPSIFTEERSMLYNNRAAAKGKQGKNESALKDCTKALELNPTYFKALMRRAKLYEELDQLDKALADYKELHELEPTNVEVNLTFFLI
ncbi:hypothetical protein DAPPUDRAFT_301435 [Daphnia pulex]|uniref:Uncharacterized protein n=1 Tax=Daphnia pulex TaxID=6669 RepID=E9I0V7_DAPPU|nr:hypothetical protein DAPPUDRAFT_301435 [Daphnia pulex]|eukprot:EFX62373.1 hypothetical protein DAPPUDRAFT_301435 [Daphnia pulex]